MLDEVERRQLVGFAYFNRTFIPKILDWILTERREREKPRSARKVGKM